MTSNKTTPITHALYTTLLIYMHPLYLVRLFIVFFFVGDGEGPRECVKLSHRVTNPRFIYVCHA